MGWDDDYDGAGNDDDGVSGHLILIRMTTDSFQGGRRPFGKETEKFHIKSCFDGG